MRLLVALYLIIAATNTAGAANTSRFSSRDVERDWLSNLNAPAHTGVPTTVQDAAGGCDGVKDGKWGFHTAHEKSPWWQVDLGSAQSIAEIRVWNRCDPMANRTASMMVKLSADGRGWRTAYTHDGTSFLGFSDKRPLQIKVAGESTRFVRLQLPGTDYLHLDEVEVFGTADSSRNLALNAKADQSSVSEWSRIHAGAVSEPDWTAATLQVVTRCDALIEEIENGSSRRESALTSSDFRAIGRIPPRGTVTAVHGKGKRLQPGTAALDQIRRVAHSPLTRTHYLAARTALRALLLSHPLFDFDDLLFVKRAPGTYSHMSDQYYGWWSRPGGGVFVLKNWKSDSSTEICLTGSFAPGSFLKPELSYDGKRVLFSYARFHPHVREVQDKVNKANVPEDAFYHVFEMNLDGSGLRQLTRGRYDDFNARYLPNGEIVFLSTRRGQFVQTSKHCATTTLDEDALPDSYVRCGGGNWRPVAVYTLHVMDAAGRDLRAISPFENFEWDPVVANDGRILYARWDYVDRDNMPFMSLWSTNPDGSNPQLVYGNHTLKPYGVFEARPIPNSRKLVFTASAHHSISAGSLVLLDTDHGNENAAPLTRLTPEVPFPEVESWPKTWYATPYPLSESLFLTAWSPHPLRSEGREPNLVNGLGLYVYHASGARELIYRDAEISSQDPIPVRARELPQTISSGITWDGAQEGRFLLLDVYDGLEGATRGSVKALRVVGVPAKTQPHMNQPQLGVTADDPGKFVLGTVPVEADGSAHFRVPSGVNVFFQALNSDGVAIQTMRTVSYVQPGQALSCVGCHEHRATAPVNHNAIAARRDASKLTPGPDGSWPFRFDRLVQPVLDSKCAGCHRAGAEVASAAKFDLTAPRAYEALINYGKPSLREHVRKRYYEGRSLINEGAASTSALLQYLRTDKLHRELNVPGESMNRLVTWVDLYGQRLGSFSDEQERELERLRKNSAEMLAERDSAATAVAGGRQ